MEAPRPPLPPLRQIKPIDRRAGRQARRRLLGLLAAGALAILAALSLPIAEKWREPQEAVESSDASPGDGHRGIDPSRPGLLESSRGPSPPAPSIDNDRPAAKLTPAVPWLPVVPGKIGIVALDTKTRQPDTEVAQAMATALARTGIAAIVVKADVPYVERLMADDFSSLPPDGRSPWGVEVLLAATVSSRRLPQSNSVLESVALTMGTQLIAVGSRSMTLRNDATHTGTGPTPEAALIQAVERCLGRISDVLKGEYTDEGSQ